MNFLLISLPIIQEVVVHYETLQHIRRNGSLTKNCLWASRQYNQRDCSGNRHFAQYDIPMEKQRWEFVPIKIRRPIDLLYGKRAEKASISRALSLRN